MRTIVLAVVLTVMQTAPPVPRKAPDNQADSTQTIEKEPKSKQAPTAPSPVIHETVKSPSTEKGGNQPQKANEEDTIRVRELPPVEVATDFWSKLYVIFTGALVIIGGWGARLALRTLRGIERQGQLLTDQINVMRYQTIVSEYAAKAAQDSAQSAKVGVEAALTANKATAEGLGLQKVAMEQWIDVDS